VALLSLLLTMAAAFPPQLQVYLNAQPSLPAWASTSTPPSIEQNLHADYMLPEPRPLGYSEAETAPEATISALPSAPTSMLAWLQGA
jgi:hypothetical protein